MMGSFTFTCGVATWRKDRIMKANKQTQSNQQKQPLPTTSGPLHRFYQRRSWENKFSMAEKRSRIPTHNLEDQGGRLRKLFQQYQHDVYHRQHSHTAHLLQQETQEVVHASFPVNNAKARSPLRVVWLQQKLQQVPKALALRTRFTDAGMQVNLHQLELEEEPALDGELILLECLGMFEQEMLTALAKLRLFSKAPLIILTDNYALDWSLRALHSGADAIFTVNMPDDVILARSKALLRRWVSI